MQVAEVKTSTSAQHQIQKKRQPFFNKEGQGGFFSKSSETSQSFFSPTTIQPKLTIGQPNDKYEVEADAMADKVVQRLATGHAEPTYPAGRRSRSITTITDGSHSSVQRKCTECEQEEKLQKKEEPLANSITSIQRKPIFESNAEQSDLEVQTKPIITPIVQTKCDECEQEEIEEGDKELEVQKKEVVGATDADQDEEDPNLQLRSLEMEKTEYPILFKKMPSLQLSSSGGASTGSRERVVEEAQKMVGKIEAKKNDGSGRRVGAEHLLEIFHLAAKDEWSDEVIENVRYTSELPHWCGIFSVYAIKKAGIDLGYWQMGLGVSAFGTLQPTDNPQPGDIGYFTKFQHHCIIKAVNDDTIDSIDGNSGNFSEVKERTRSKSQFHAFFTPFTGSEKIIQKKEEASVSSGIGSNSLQDKLNVSSGKGSPIDANTRSQMESGFDMDFSKVNIHTNSHAVQMNKDLNAQAFTHGNDIYFNEGKYDTNSTSGKHLLAHELTHTIQQVGSNSLINKSCEDNLDEDNQEPFEGACAVIDRRDEVQVYLNQLVFEYVQYASQEDAAFDELINYKLEISSVKREILILETIFANSLLRGELENQDQDIEDLFQQVYNASLDEQATINMIVGEGASESETLDMITYLMTSMPDLFPDYTIRLYGLAVEEFNEIAQGHADDYLEAIGSFNEQETEDIATSFIWMMENQRSLRRSASTVHFFTWFDQERPFFLERKDENSTSTEMDNLKVRINDHNFDFTSPLAIERLDFLYPMLVSWHHFQFYSRVAEQLDLYKRIVEVTYERLNEYGSYPDLAVDMRRVYHSSAPQVDYDTMRSGFDDIYDRIQQKLDEWVDTLSWDEKIREGFGLYDIYGEMGQQLKAMVTPEAIAMMVGFIAFLIAIQYVPYANIVVDAILIALGGIDILIGLTIFGTYFDRASDATSFRRLYRASQGLKGGGEAILNLLFELIGLAASRAIRSYARYRNTRRFDSLDDIANHDVIRDGNREIREAFEEARSSTRSFNDWEEGLNDETRRFLNNDANTRVRDIYMEMSPDLRRIFTHCASNCLIPNITRRQVDVVRQMIARLGNLNPAIAHRLKVLLHVGRNDLDWIMRMLNRVENESQLDTVVLQEFRRRAMEPPGGRPANLDAEAARNAPGVATGGNSLPQVTDLDDWLGMSSRSSQISNTVQIPKQVADALRNQNFSNMAALRTAIWREIGRHPLLRGYFARNNGVKGILHHITPIENGGAVLDFDNLLITTSTYHDRIHHSGYDGSGTPFIIRPKLGSAQPNDKYEVVKGLSESKVANNLQSQLNSSKGAGSPLPSGIQKSMGSEFGSDFSNVRIHTGSEAIQMSQDIGAQAFTHDNDIYFNEGKFSPESSSGKHLLAHELTHTVQQNNNDISRQTEEDLHEPSADIESSFLLKSSPEEYVKRHAPNISGHVGYKLSKVKYQIPINNVEWRKGNSTDFVIALWEPIWSNKKNLWKILSSIIAPDPLSVPVNAGRDAIGVDGKIGWDESVALEIKSHVSRKLISSLKRIIPRYVSVMNQLELAHNPSLGTKIRSPKLTEVFASHPIDVYVIKGLEDQLRVNYSAYRQENPHENKIKEIPQKLRSVTLEFQFSQGAPNWVKVSSPENATKEEVAKELYGTETKAWTLTGTYPYFGIHRSTNSRDTRRVELYKMMPSYEKLYDVHIRKPRLNVRVAGSLPEKMETGMIRSEVAISQSKSLKPTGVEPKVIIQRMRLTLNLLSKIGGVMVGLGQRVKLPWVDRTYHELDVRSHHLNTYKPENIPKWDAQSLAQLKLVTEAYNGLLMAQTQSEAFKGWTTVNPVIGGLVKNYVDVVRYSHYYEMAKEKLDWANNQSKLFPVMLMETLLAEVRKTINDARTDKTKVHDAKNRESIYEIEVLDKKEKGLRERLSKVRDVLLQNPEKAKPLLSEILKELTDLQVGTTIVANMDALDQIWKSLFDSLSFSGTIRSIWGGGNDILSDAMASKRKLWREWSAIYEKWKHGDKGKAQKELAKKSASKEWKQYFHEVANILEDHALIDKWMNLGLMVGIAIITGGIGAYVEAAAGAAWGVTALTGRAALTSWRVWAASGVAITTEAAVFTTLSTAILEKDPSFSGFVNSFGENILLFGGLRGISKSVGAILGPEKAATVLGKTTEIATQYSAINGYALYKANKEKHEKSGKGLTWDEIWNISFDNLVFVIAVSIGSKLAQPAVSKLVLSARTKGSIKAVESAQNKLLDVAKKIEVNKGKKNEKLVEELKTKKDKLLEAQQIALKELVGIASDPKAAKAAGISESQSKEFSENLQQVQTALIVSNLEPIAKGEFLCSKSYYDTVKDFYENQKDTKVIEFNTDPVTNTRSLLVVSPKSRLHITERVTESKGKTLGESKPEIEAPKTELVKESTPIEKTEIASKNDEIASSGLAKLKNLFNQKNVNSILEATNAETLIPFLRLINQPYFIPQRGVDFYKKLAGNVDHISFGRTYGAKTLGNLIKRYRIETLPQILETAELKIESTSSNTERVSLIEQLQTQTNPIKINEILGRPNPKPLVRPKKATKKSMGVDRSHSSWKMLRSEAEQFAKDHGEKLTSEQVDIRADLEQVLFAAKKGDFKRLRLSTESKIKIIDRFDGLALDSKMPQSLINNKRGSLTEWLFLPTPGGKKTSFAGGEVVSYGTKGSTVPDYDIPHSGFREWVNLKSDIINVGKQSGGVYLAGKSAASKYLKKAKIEAANLPSGDKYSIDFIRDPGPVTRSTMIDILINPKSPVYRVKFGDIWYN